MRTTAQIAKSGVVALGGFTCRPARYYPGSVGIRIVGVLARHATECRLVGPVFFGDVSAFGTFPAGVPGVHIDHRNTGECCFVRDKHSQLEKRPTMENCSLLAPNRHPTADATKLFQLDSAPRASSASNDLFTNSGSCDGRSVLPYPPISSDGAWRRGSVSSGACGAGGGGDGAPT